MGKPRVLHRGLILALAGLLAACGGDAPLLVTADAQEVVYGAGGPQSNYVVRSWDPAVRGKIRGRVTFGGAAPAPKPRPIDMGGIEYCVGAHRSPLLSEELRVGADGGIRDVIVYVKKGGSGPWPAREEAVVLDQKGCQYLPHVAVVQTGQPLVIKSSDPIMHNVKNAPRANQQFNRAMSGVGQLEPFRFLRPEMPPMLVECNVHNWMKSWVAVLPHPLHAVTAEDGSYEIAGVPPGTYQLGFWQEKLGEQVMDVTVENSQTLVQDFKMGGS